MEPRAVGQPKRHRLLHFAFALFTLEIGMFLVLFPWFESWTSNYFQNSLPFLEAVWDDPYFRGAISGLGLVNIYLATVEFSHFWRKSS